MDIPFYIPILIFPELFPIETLQILLAYIHTELFIYDKDGVELRESGRIDRLFEG